MYQFWKNVLAACALSQIPAYHLIFFLQSWPGLYYPQIILQQQQLTKESSHTVPKTPLPAEKCTSHEKCTIIPIRKKCITHQWSCAHSSGYFWSSVQLYNWALYREQDINYGPCSVLPCMVSCVVFKSGESNPCLLFSFSASSCFHLPLCSYNSAAVITLTKCRDESWIITFYLEPCHAGKMVI